MRNPVDDGLAEPGAELLVNRMETSPQKRDNTTPSCQVCQRRKVKCDRVYPCAACTKSGLQCTFPPPGRHGKRARRNTTHSHAPQEPAAVPYAYPADRATNRPTSRHASTLRLSSNNGLKQPEFPSPESNYSSTTSTARLVSDGNGYRYVNNHLWNALSDDGPAVERSRAASPGDGNPPLERRESRTTGDGDMTASEKSFVFGRTSTPAGTTLAQPTATHVVFLWQTYLANVDPVMKISHAPTIQPIVLGQIGSAEIQRNEWALTAAIYLVSTVSLTDEQCRESLQDTRANLLALFRETTETALSAAGFITTTDSLVLQALVLYLAALRSLGEVQTVWSLFGLAIRIAGTIGLTRDGTSFNLSPFDTEMRRRLWWGIVYFDGRMAELVGQEGDLMGNDYEAHAPANLNDNDLFPMMSKLPESRKGPTDAIYLQARILSVNVARSLQTLTGPQGTWHRLHDATLSTAEKLQIMERIDQRYNEEILETCDPSVPIQYMSINTARTFATKLRLIARIPVVDLNKDWEDADGFSENAFLLSMDLLQLQVDLWCEPMVRQWRWHWQAHFQWYALVCLLRQTRLRQTGHGIHRAWSLIQKAFHIIIPTLELGPRKSLLLDGIHKLLNATKHQQRDMKLPAGFVDGDEAVRPASSDSTTYGSRPHTARMFKIESSQLQTPVSFERAAVGEMDPMLGFDLDAIDWVEFDRLASELCQQ